MSLKVYNVLTRKKEEFIPLNGKNVNMYACGITVSGNAHIGHAYQAIIFDMIRKYLEFKDYKVKYVRNYTDVDDKIILKARELKMDPKEYAKELIIKTNSELDALGVDRPDVMSNATDCIQDMIEFISKLIETNHAYSTKDGNVFFRVSSFPNYGNFSNRVIDESLVGVRKEIEPGKEDDKDFALWKTAKDDEIFWDSPWGKGRPGWHIECSTMSMKFLGETLDIHGGGKDLLFPHHENEIAQSESLTGKQFSKYWIHNGLVKVNGQKMSKSLNNGILLEDLIKKYNKDVTRMTLLQNNYRSDLNIMDGIFESNEKNIYHIYNLFKTINLNALDLTVNSSSDIYKKVTDEFIEAMDNDFNTSLAIANIFNYASEISQKINKSSEKQYLLDMMGAIKNTYKVLGMFNQDPQSVIDEINKKYMELHNTNEKEIVSLIEKRNDFKKSGDYESADKIRNELQSKGIEIKDTREGTIWEVIFAQ